MTEGKEKAADQTEEIRRCTAALKLRFGLTVRGVALAHLLGHNSLSTYYREVARGRVPVKLHPIPRQKGRCALTADVGRWLVESDKKWDEIERLIDEAVAAARK